MAESTGVNYNLDRGILQAVSRAGLGGEARERLQQSAVAGAIGNIAEDVVGKIKEKQEDTATRLETWDSGFDAMGDKGSWASGELFDQFQAIEAGYRDEYVEAVRTGDKQAQRRLLKEQASRSAGLTGWQETMETAKQINDGVGWSTAFKGPKNKENREIILALTKLDGKTAVAKFGDNGEMVFDIKLAGPPPKTITKTRREVDDMIAEGVKPLKQEQAFMETLLDYQKAGSNGDMFDYDTIKRNNLLNMNDQEIPALMREDFGGGGTFADHIKTHPDMIQEFADVMGNGDGVVDEEEAAALRQAIDNDVNSIVDLMEQTPDVAKEYLSEWITLQQQSAWQKGSDYKASKTKERLDANKSNKTYTMTTAEKNLAAAEKENTRRASLRQEEIVITNPKTGEEANFGFFGQYGKDEGGWYNKEAKFQDGSVGKMYLKEMGLINEQDLIQALEGRQPIVSSNFG